MVYACSGQHPAGFEVDVELRDIWIFQYMREDEILGILERAGAASGGKKGGK